jgi:hypothetical protein
MEPNPHWFGPPTDSPRQRRQKEEEHPHHHTNNNTIRAKLERLHSTKLIRRNQNVMNSRHAKASSSADSSLLAAIINHF